MVRFDLEMDGEMEPSDEGRWVMYHDHRQALDEKDAAYQQLMEQAVRFAEAYRSAHLSNWIDLVTEDRAEEMAAKDPVYVEAQAFLKERGRR